MVCMLSFLFLSAHVSFHIIVNQYLFGWVEEILFPNASSR